MFWSKKKKIKKLKDLEDNLAEQAKKAYKKGDKVMFWFHKGRSYGVALALSKLYK